MGELILHHYDFSPFSEKIRLIFGLKRLSWHSVIIPATLPKPDLVALTGGYRHTPVLQIGADIFCDTRLIAREINRRYPSPSLFKGTSHGLASVVETWADANLFWPIARYVSGMNAENLGSEFHADRAALRGKPVPSIERLKQAAVRSLDALQAEIPRVEDMLSDGRPYLLSDSPGLADFSVYHGFWFLSAFEIDCSGVLAPFPLIRAWMTRIRAIGHGTRLPLDSRAALALAAGSDPEAVQSMASESALFQIGAQVSVRPENYDTNDVRGKIVAIDTDRIALLREDSESGRTVVHFPRIGYIVRRL